MQVSRAFLTRSLLALTLVAAAELAAPPAARAVTMDRFTVGNWRASAQASRSTGAFSHCAASARYKSGITLFFSVTRQRDWIMAFSSPDWNLRSGSRHDIEYRVDKLPILSGVARAVSKTLVRVDLPAKSTIFSDFRHGDTLFVKVNDTVLRFALTDADQLLESLLDCVREHVAAEKKDPFAKKSTPDPFSGPSTARRSDTPDPFGDDSSARASSGPTAATRAEAMTAAAIMLGRSGVKFTFLTEKELPKMYARHDVIWRSGRFVGSLRVARTMTAKAIEASVIASDAKACKGKFASGSLVEGDAGPAGAGRLFTACEKPDGSGWSTYYSILTRREGGNYLISIFGKIDDDDDLKAYGGTLTDVAISLNEKGSVPGAESSAE